MLEMWTDQGEWPDWFVKLSGGKPYGEFFGEGRSPSEAICIAALNSVGVHEFPF